MKDFEVSVTGTVNAGICISFPNGRRLWFDLYPDGETPMFSHMTDDQWEYTKKDPRLAPPDLVFFSHTHPDHFSALRSAEARSLWPDVPVYLPDRSVWKPSEGEKPFDYIPIAGDEMSVTLDGITVRMMRTVHSGQQFANVHHYSFLIRFQRGGIHKETPEGFSADTRQIFISADALLTDDKLIQRLEGIRTNLAVLTFPWASTSIGRERVEYSIQPSHVLLYHIPGEEKNSCGFRQASRSGSELLNVPDVRLLMQPFASETFVL